VQTIKGQFGSHLCCSARAGTGKTFILVEGACRTLGKPTPGITPSEEQAAIFEAMADGNTPRKIVQIAFNRSVKQELAKRIKQAGLNKQVVVMTAHGFGLMVLKRHRLARTIERNKTYIILERIHGTDLRTLLKNSPGYAQAVDKIVELCKVNLIGLGIRGMNDADPETIDWVIGHYGVDVPDENMDTIYNVVPMILDESRQMVDVVDYPDMVSLPLALDLYTDNYAMAMVDEAQDLTVAARYLGLRAGQRTIIVGDPYQAIYGFAGADCESFNKFQAELLGSPRRCGIYPLTRTRRCGEAIVRLAQTIVPDIQGLGTHEGRIINTSEDNYLARIDPNARDMVICRTNAPLVSGVMRMLQQRQPAWIEGREFGDDLKGLVKRLAPSDIPDLAGKLDDWYGMEMAKLERRKYVSEDAKTAIADKRECLGSFMQGVETVRELVEAIDAVFQDTTDSEGNIVERRGTRFSSIHRAKGLEADTVHYLRHDTSIMAKASGWQLQQEYNLKYVGFTRARHTLNLIDSGKRR
jgi:superfamily I DNA/RNA helicase